MQLPMIGTMEIDSGKREREHNQMCIYIYPSISFLLVYENGNHSTYQDDDECDSSAAHPGKISLDEDILPTTMPTDEDDDEPGTSARRERERERETKRISIDNEY